MAVAPQGITSTEWPSVRETCERKLGIEFDDWQHGAGRVILSKRADGKLAASVDGIGMSLPRQVGKTYLIGAMIFALCVNRPGLLVIWSAHHARTHGETFLAMQGFAERAKVKPHIAQVFLGSGDEEVRFHNGSRILFGARERGFGRGIPGVDVLVFDEAQILSDRALANMLATMNTSDFGLHLYVGTPPRTEDNSEVFRRMRADAIAGRLVDGGWIEFGADRSSKPDDRRQWSRANPSYPRRTPVESILRLMRKLTPEDFLREGLGIWDEIELKGGIIPPLVWDALRPDLSDPDETRTVPDLTEPPAALGLDMSPQRNIAISGCWRVGERFHGEVLSLAELDTASAVEWLKTRAGRRIPVVVDAASAAASLVPALEQAKVKVVVTNAPDMGKACGSWFDLSNEGRVTHAGQEPLDKAVAASKKRAIGKSDAWGLAREDGTDISPLVSFVLALFGASGKKAAKSPVKSGVPRRATVM